MSFPAPSERRVDDQVDTLDDPLWRLEQKRLKRGLITHGVLFVLVMSMLFMVNSMTRGDDGSWWAIAVLEIWAVAWTLHLVGVAITFSKPGGIPAADPLIERTWRRGRDSNPRRA